MMRITPGLHPPGGETTERRRAIDLGQGEAAATDPRTPPFIERRGVPPKATADEAAAWGGGTTAPRGPRNLGRLVERTSAPSRAFDAAFLNTPRPEAGVEIGIVSGRIRTGVTARAPSAPEAPAAADHTRASVTVRIAPPQPVPQSGPPVFDQQALDHPCIRHLDAQAAFNYARAFLDHQRRTGAVPTPGSPGAALTRDLKAAVTAVARYEHTAFGRALFNPDEVAQQVQLVMARHAR